MTAKLSILGVAAVATIPVALSCGGYEGGTVRPIVDAAIDANEPCVGAATYSPSFGSDDVQAQDVPADPDEGAEHQQYFTGFLNDDDVLYVDLFAEYGAFEGGDIMTGSFPIQGDDINYSSCGACITIAAGDEGGVVDDWYMASSGILTLSNVTTRMTGRLQNVLLRRVITDSDGNPSDTPTGDCQTHIMSATFDAAFDGSGSAMATVRKNRFVLRNRR